MWRISWKDLLIYALLIILLGLAGCHPVFVSEDQMTAYSRPAGSSVENQLRPIVWIYFHNSASRELHDVLNVAQEVLGVCGFQIAGVAFADSLPQMFPPPQFRLDLTVYTEPLGQGYGYRTLRIHARMVRAEDNVSIAEAQRSVYHAEDGRSRFVISPSGVRVPIHASERLALEEAARGAIGSLCSAHNPYEYENPFYPRPAAIVPSGTTLCGYGASGKTTKSGALDMRYGCQR